MPADSRFDARVPAILGIPFHQFLGMELRDADDPAAGIWFPVGPPTLNPVGLLHAGVVYSLLDVACFLALIRHLGDDEHAVTHDLTVSLLRPVSPRQAGGHHRDRAAPRPPGRLHAGGRDGGRPGRRRGPGDEERRPGRLITRATSTGGRCRRCRPR